MKQILPYIMLTGIAMIALPLIILVLVLFSPWLLRDAYYNSKCPRIEHGYPCRGQGCELTCKRTR